MRKSQKSKSTKKHDKDKDRKKSKHDPDPDTHPLNLPPDQLRQLSAQMARQEAEANRASMSMDRDTPETNSHDADANNGATNGTSPPATPSRDAPGAFPEQENEQSESTNGVNGANGADERSPTPPPHKVTPPPRVDPEACKAAGNKFFKAKDYEKAIAEYTKGSTQSESCSFAWLTNSSQRLKLNLRILHIFQTEQQHTYQQTNTARL
jgi:DnaJ family protein C protein 7